MLGSSTQGLTMEVSQAALCGAQRSRALRSPGEQRGGGRRLQGDFFPTLEASHGHIPLGWRCRGLAEGNPWEQGMSWGRT